MKTEEEILNDYIQDYEIEGLNEDQIKQYKEHVQESSFFKFHLASKRLTENLNNGIIQKIVNRLSTLLK